MSRQFEIESLENRTLLSASQVSFANFLTTTHLVGNGFGNNPMTVNNRLELTSNQYYQGRSVWFDQAVPIGTFRSDFSFQSDRNTIGADGITFTIQNGSTSFLGYNGRDLGYGRTLGVKSVAIAFDQFNYQQFGSKFGFARNGEKPPTKTPMGAIDLHSGHKFNVSVLYNGNMLSVTVTDSTDTSKVFSASERIDLQSVLGTSQAIVGFTGATGANRSYHDILDWNYSGKTIPAPVVPPPQTIPTPPSPPSFVHDASANPNPSNGTSSVLTALGSDVLDSEKKLTYTWHVVSKPTGAKTPTFSKNGTNAAKSSLAHFAKDGLYTFQVAVTNTRGLSAFSNVRVRVYEVATSVAVTPHKVSLRVGRRVTFDATMLDQFNRPLRVQPTFSYSLQSGTGRINANTGLYVAPSSVGHDVIAATASGITGTIGVTIYPLEDRPTVGASA